MKYGGKLWQYRDGCYDIVDEGGELRGDVYEFLESVAPQHQRKRHVNEILDALATLVPQASRDGVWLDGHQQGQVLACANGHVDLDTGRLLPPNPGYFTASAIPVAFDPQAPEPVRWMQFLPQIWPDDPDAVRLLQQWFGYLLTTDTSQQKLLALIGPPASGKGTIARVLESLLGPGAVASPAFSALAERFGLQDLPGKRLLVLSDSEYRGRALAGAKETLLRITGEDAVQFDVKYMAPCTLQLGCRVMILANEYPQIPDTSGALARRIMPLQMTRSFQDTSDAHLGQKLRDELPGILTWALAGLADLRRSGRFIVPISSQQAAQDAKLSTSPGRAFVESECEVGPGLEVPVEDLYQAFLAFSDINPADCSRQKFGRLIRAAAPGISRGKGGNRGGKRAGLYRGICLKPTHTPQAQPPIGFDLKQRGGDSCLTDRAAV